VNASSRKRIYLSPPHMGGDELGLVQEAFASNWIAPLGPHVDGFERVIAAHPATASRVQRGRIATSARLRTWR
jgi:pyridoxal phosphate-dependent aminotransferase EpsN